MGFFSAQNHISESYGNGKTTLENGGRNPPDVTLDDIAKDLLSYFNKFEYLRQTKRNIEEKYDIKNEYDYWSADDIRRAWGKTQRMGKKSDRRKHWAHVITLQILNRQVYDGCKQNTAQEIHDHTTDETKQSCEKTPVIKENKDDNSCEKQKIIDNHEKLPNQMKAERENGGGEDDLWSDINQAGGKAEIMKGHSEDRSSHSSADLETVEAAGEDKKSSGAIRKSSKINQTNRDSRKPSGAQRPAGSQATRNDRGAPAEASGTDVSAAERDEAEDDTEETCIRIPLSEILRNELTQRERNEPTDANSPYKLIDGLPSNSTDIRKRKSYIMSFNHQTNNAEWVYEILNRETLEDNCSDLESFGDVYHKGHLAAARNHRWCQEASNDADLFSNIVPHHKKLNQGMWTTLENHCRRLERDNENCNVHVYTGPLYLKNKKGKYTRVPNPKTMDRIEGKVIPTHFFKVIIVENIENGTVRNIECYRMPNEPPQHKELNDYKIDIFEFQKVSGLTFIESRPNREMRSYTKLVTLQGEVGNGQLCGVNIRVRINSQHR